MLDYFTLKLIWWLLIGFLLIGFAVMDGHDMGVGILLPFMGRDYMERRVMINTVAPHWECNQVWLVTAGGAIFAAWPFVYATAFSGMYAALMLVLFALFFRPVGFTYRSKLTHPVWRQVWDWGLFIGSAVPALIFGVAFGNLFHGVPFSIDDTMRSTYSGNLLGLLNPMALLFGLVSVSLVTLQGATYLAHRTQNQTQQRARFAVRMAGAALLLSFIAAGFWVARTDGYVIHAMPDPGGVLTPLMKEVVRAPGAWFNNYHQHPVLWMIPALAVAATLASMLLASTGRTLLAFACSSLVCLTVILTAGVALFPFVLPSSSMPAVSLTAWDAVSSHKTLHIMFWVAMVLTPVIVAYTSWAYYVMRGKITPEYIQANDKALY